jgi:hypothetical protein
MPIIGEIAHHKMSDREVVIGGKDRSVIAEQLEWREPTYNTSL